MRKPPEKPAFLRSQGEKITLPKSTPIIDSMEQRPYSRREVHAQVIRWHGRKLEFL